jgi:hypothetical protein
MRGGGFLFIDGHAADRIEMGHAIALSESAMLSAISHQPSAAGIQGHCTAHDRQFIHKLSRLNTQSFRFQRSPLGGSCRLFKSDQRLLMAES